MLVGMGQVQRCHEAKGDDNIAQYYKYGQLCVVSCPRAFDVTFS